MHPAQFPAAVRRRVRTAIEADGGRRSGLSALLELHAVHTGGDALIAVALAGTLFFSVPLDEARSSVALYLLVTMAPFALVAPVIGPVLDRLRRGRRLALAGTMLGRAVLAYIMARSQGGLALYPAAFGVLVLSKGYGVARSAVVPRVLPPGVTLVSANARLSLAGITLAGILAPLGFAVNHFAGFAWTLRATVVVFVGATLLATRLPGHVDDIGYDETDAPHHPALEPASASTARAATDPTANLTATDPTANQTATDPAANRTATDPAATAGTRSTVRHRRRSLGLPRPVAVALRAAASLRALTGFLMLFLAFLLRAEEGGKLVVGLLVVALGFGSFVGSVLGARLPARAPEILFSTAVGLATLACAFGAGWFTPATAVVVAGVGGMTASVGKLALDSTIQRTVGDEHRASIFARSETVLQLSWVLGGGLGLALPLHGALGLGTAAGWLGVTLAATLASLLHRSQPARAATDGANARPAH